MSTKTFFDYDPMLGVTEWFHQDADGSFAIEAVQDVTAIIEHNKRVQNADTGRYRTFTEVANIGMVEFQSLIQQGILDVKGRIRDQKAMRRWLNDNSNSAWRAKLGKV